jgi:hypothetical protein
MDGQEYYSLNPGMFSEKTQWTYQNLKSLCKELGLGGAGKRCELEAKLQEWHLTRAEGENLVPSQDHEENLPMNVLGSNFNILKIIPPSERSQKGNRSKKRQSLIPSLMSADDKENYNCTSPVRSFCPATPGKSILKQDSRLVNCPVSATKLHGIKFSPFNKVRIIPHRIFHVESFQEELSDCEDANGFMLVDGANDDDSDSDCMEYEYE